jgi:hypothetical protein
MKNDKFNFYLQERLKSSTVPHLMPHYSPEITSWNKYMSTLLMIILHV